MKSDLESRMLTYHKSHIWPVVGAAICFTDNVKNLVYTQSEHKFLKWTQFVGVTIPHAAAVYGLHEGYKFLEQYF